MKYNKLVRDKIPEIIRKKGEECKIHVAGGKEYLEKLKEKLLEEVKEFIENETVEEMTDIQEVMEAICGYKNFSKRELESVKKKRVRERGGFKKKIILEES